MSRPTRTALGHLEGLIPARRVTSRPVLHPRVPPLPPRSPVSTHSPRRSKRSIPLPLSLLVLPPIIYYLYDSTRPRPSLSPYEYTEHALTRTRRVSAQHAEIAVQLNDASEGLFRHPGFVAAGPATTGVGVAGGDGGEAGAGLVTVHHVMLKNPDLMIERPYTPVNDVAADGEARMVVKRVTGGEVGR